MSSPSPYRIPQRTPPDRQNARKASIEARRALYPLRTDDLVGDPHEGFRLPAYLPAVPSEASFSMQKLSDLLGHKLEGQINGLLSSGRVRSIDDYGRMFKVLPRPETWALWDSDEELARQRVAGVDPMHLRAIDRAPEGVLADAAARAIEPHGTTIAKVLDRGRLFETDYSMLADDRVQRYARASRRWLAAPRCLWFVGDDDVLRPLAIAFPADAACDEERAFCPLDDRWAWRQARWHAQAADGTVHEAIYHLFETHMVTELIALCAARNLHVDHPVSHLLAPHFEFNLAIDVLARSDMLAPGKAIDLALSAGSAGALNAVRMWIADSWSWEARSIDRELAARGVLDRARLPDYPYRDDALPLHGILRTYVAEVMAPFYPSEAAVAGDHELAAFLLECGEHLAGFPKTIATREHLFRTLSEIVFRASVQHAAVNNGQLDAYGWIPNSPGSMLAPPPSSRTSTEAEAIASLPRGGQAMAQLAMAWVLSEPTHYGLLGIGDAPAFAADLCPEAREAVSTVRRKLVAYQAEIEERNERRAVPYRYLDPRNVERSTGT